MSKQILVVEDEVLLQQNLIRGLRREGFVVQGVWDGAQARSHLRSSPIEVLLLDLGLPDCDGLEFLTCVRTLYPQVLVIVMTGQAAPELETRAYQLGARAFLRKPFPLQRLQEALCAVGRNLRGHLDEETTGIFS